MYNDTRRSTTSVADDGGSVLSILQLVKQGDQDPASRAAERVSQRDGTTSRVHVVGTETEDLGVGLDDRSKGLVELPDGDVFFGKTGLSKELLDTRCRCDREVDGVCVVLAKL